MQENSPDITTISHGHLTAFVEVASNPLDDFKELVRVCSDAINVVAKNFTTNRTNKTLTEFSIKFSDDCEVKDLNNNFRGKNTPTNVLSFESDEDDDIIGEPTYIGDIILAKETIIKEAIEQSKPLKHHLVHLIIHGILHLHGLDHIEEAQAEEMEALEIELLHKLEIPNPYATTE